jgi:hypothetical protein
MAHFTPPAPLRHFMHDCMAMMDHFFLDDMAKPPEDVLKTKENTKLSAFGT